MAMGSTGTVNVSPEMMQNALKAIDEYRSTANSIHSELTSTVSGIIPGNFSGSAATGFKAFYDNKIDPLVEANSETGSLAKLLNALKEMCEGILKAIPDSEGVDEKLAEGNNQ